MYIYRCKSHTWESRYTTMASVLCMAREHDTALNDLESILFLLSLNIGTKKLV